MSLIPSSSTGWASAALVGRLEDGRAVLDFPMQEKKIYNLQGAGVKKQFPRS